MRRHPHWRYAIPLFLLLAGVDAATAQFVRPPVRPVIPEPYRPVLPETYMPRLPTAPRPFVLPEPFVRPWEVPPGLGRPQESYFMARPGASPRPGVFEPGYSFGLSSAHPELHPSPYVNPFGALEAVARSPRTGQVPHFEHRQVVQESLNELARSAQTGRDPWATARALQGFRDPATPFSQYEHGQLDAMQALLEREALQRGVTTVARLGEQKEWRQTGEAAREWLKGQAQTFPEKGPQPSPDQLAVRKPLEEMNKLSQRIEALDRVEAAVRPGSDARPWTPKALEGVAPETLPAEMGQVAKGLRGLAALQEAAAVRWGEAPNVAGLKQSVAEFERALSSLPANPDGAGLAGRVRQDLAMKAFLENQPAVARELWPKDGPADHAANLLRDMKALLAGRGEVSSWPAAQALPPEPGQGGGTPRGPPPGLKFLLPEEPGDGWHPPVRAKATEGLPPLAEAAKQAEPLRDAVAQRVPQEREAVQEALHVELQHLHGIQQQIKKDDEDEKKKTEEINKKLTVPLQPAERVWVGQQLRNGKAQDKVTEDLNKKRRDEEIERALELLRDYLAPTLTKESIAELLKAVSKYKVEFFVLDHGTFELVKFTETLAIRTLYRDGEIRVHERQDRNGDWLINDGDKIVGIAQGEGRFVDTHKKSYGEIVTMMHGRPGTKVWLKVVPNGKTAPTIIELTRTNDPAGLREKLEITKLPPEWWTSLAEIFLVRERARLGQTSQEHAEREVVGVARQLVEQGVDVADMVVLFTPVLNKERVEVPGGIRDAVRLDMVALDLGSGLGAFEYPQAQALVAAGKKPAEVASVLREQRLRTRRKHDLERVKSYLDRPPTEKELELARKLLDEDKEVADVVAGLPEALSPEQRAVDGGVREAVLLDEVRQALNPGPDGGEYARARKMLRDGSKPTQVVAQLIEQRREAFKQLLEKQIEQVDVRVGNKPDDHRNALKKWEREQAEEMLRNGMSVDETVERILRVRKHLASNE